MILYNLRYRGQYEYDKFVLNTFQYINEIQELLDDISTSDGEDNIHSYVENIDKIIKQTNDISLAVAIEKEMIRI